MEADAQDTVRTTLVARPDVRRLLVRLDRIIGTVPALRRCGVRDRAQTDARVTTLTSLHRAAPGHGCPVEWHVVARYERDDPEHTKPPVRYSILRRRDVYEMNEKYERVQRGVEWLWRDQSPYNYATLTAAISAANEMAARQARFWIRLVALAERQRMRAAEVLA